MPPRARASQPPSPEPQAAELDGQPPLEDHDEGSSRPSSTASSVADWVSDPGPEFDPGQASEDAEAREGERAFAVAPGGEAGVQVEWHPDTVRAILEAQGAALHAVAGKAETDWVYTQQELRAIAPPLTRILNRYDATKVAAASGDEFAVIMGLSGYTMRSVQERRKALALIKAAQEAAEEAQAKAAALGVQPIIPHPEEAPA